jgi:sugar lactone lactonase YvrE
MTNNYIISICILKYCPETAYSPDQGFVPGPHVTTTGGLNLKLKALIVLTLVLLSILGMPLATAATGITLTASPAAFNSNTGKTTFTYTLKGINSAHVWLQIMDSDHVTIRTVDLGTQYSGSHYYKWNGRNDASQAVPEGRYPAKIFAVTGLATLPKYLSSWASGATGIDVDGKGNVYAAETSAAIIKKYSSTGALLTQWGSSGSDDGQFLYPVDVAVSPDNKYIYVSDSGNLRIQKFGLTGKYVSKWDTGASVEQGGIAANATGYVYLIDNWGLERFKANGVAVPLSSILYQDHPGYLATDKNGKVYATRHDTGVANVVSILDANGKSAGEFGDTAASQTGAELGTFDQPYGIDTDAAGNIYVADSGNNRIEIFNPAGKFLYSFGDSGDSNGLLNAPMDVAVGPDGSIYVADWGNQRIAKFSAFKASTTAKLYKGESTVTVDNTPPTVIITMPASGATYRRNTVLKTAWTATDSGSGIRTLTYTQKSGIYIRLSSTGKKTFTVTATDMAGNKATVTNTYKVTLLL